MALRTLGPRWRPSEYMLEELLRYDAGVDMDLENIDLTGYDLAGINLTGATMTGGSLRSANLRGATLDRVCLVRTDARWVDLTGASLRGALLVDVDLCGASLADVDAAGSIDIQTLDPRHPSNQHGRAWVVGGLVGRASNGPPRNKMQEPPWV